MSSNQLHRSLKVILGYGRHPKQRTAATMVQTLGHTVVDQFVTKADVVRGLREIDRIPDLIITDITDRADLQEVYQTMTRRNVQVPLLVISPDIAKIILCDELDFVFGVCKEPLDQENFQANLYLAMHRFAKQQQVSAEARLATEALASAKATQHACAILFDRHKQKSMTAAYRLLQRIATSYRRTISEQAERIVRADLEMHPKKPTGKFKRAR